MAGYEELLKSCQGVETKEEQLKDYRGRAYTRYHFTKVGEVTVPDGVFIEVRATATAGTIGLLYGLEVSLGTDGKRISAYGGTYLYEAEDDQGKIKKGRIGTQHADVLVGQHKTKYQRNVQTHEPVEKKAPINKFKQELKKGDWVFGVGQYKTLKVGRVTRWTNHNVWAIYGDDLKDKTREFKFESIEETFLIPDDGFLSELTLATLKGWNGK
jgi:hypothetical protein